MSFEQQVDAVRRFNRFYTARIGALQQGLLRSPFTLAEARVLFEIARREAPTASDIAGDLDLDPGYLSRLLRELRRRGLVDRVASAADRRIGLLRLTGEGTTAFARLEEASRTEIEVMLRGLGGGGPSRLVDAMDRIGRLLGEPREREIAVLRPHRPGDLGWIVHRHGALYAEEYGWDDRFEGLVAGVVGDFVRDLQPAHERCFMAELDGAVVGSAMLVAARERDLAKLRLLLVEPEARGRGLGRRLTDECIRFARSAGYRRVTLWTQSILTAARAIYERAGFRLVAQESHRRFGPDLLGETWELDLKPQPPPVASTQSAPDRPRRAAERR